MENNFNPDEVKAVYLIPESFFTDPNFLERCKQQLSLFRRQIETLPKEEVKGSINVFTVACLGSPLIDDNTKLELRLMIFETLNYYAQQYQNAVTFQNIIREFENKDFKEKLFGKFPVASKLICAETLFQYYNLIKHQPPLFSLEKTELIIKAKSYLWKIYIHSIEKKITISNANLSHCLTLLAGCLTELSRWFEPLYLLNIAKSNLSHNPNIEYLRAFLLQAIKEKTCLDYNYLLLLKIIDSCKENIKQSHSLSQQKNQMIELETECRTFLKSKKVVIEKLRKHKNNVVKSYKNYNPYRKFCLENQLYLNEHSFFCNCSKATRDNIVIKTNHTHTTIEWVAKFEKQIDLLASDFIVGRQNYYNSLDATKIPHFRVNAIKRNDSNQNIKIALLKNSFKTFYSILDQISYGIFKVLEIDFEKKLKEQDKEKKGIPKLYFLKMWDYELFEENHFENNFYLTSLYSIAKDLDKTDYAALKEFKEIRNAIEHKILFIVENEKQKKEYAKTDLVFTKEEILEKTRILMILTKSAIFSFTYLIRRQSKLITLAENK